MTTTNNTTTSTEATLREIIEKSGITPVSESGQPKSGWLKMTFDWGPVKGRAESIAYQLRAKLYERIGETVCGHQDDNANKQPMHVLTMWVEQLTQIIDERARARAQEIGS